MKAFKALCLALILSLLTVSSISEGSDSRLVLPAGLKTIEAEAFEGATGISEVVLPEGNYHWRGSIC